MFSLFQGSLAHSKHISLVMCCVSLELETPCALGYLDLCLRQLNFIKGIVFRIFTAERNQINTLENVNQ